MAAAPWYLLAAGILIVIAGLLIAMLGRGGGNTYIDPRMSDKEIARQMKRNEGSPLAGIVMAVGFLAILVSIVWRIVLRFV